MSFQQLKFSLLLGVYAQVFIGHSATHDELPQCGLSGVYKTRQSIIESPNYPNNYPTSTCWDYVIRSPYRCPTKFHIQFLDFHLESSNNCTNDYLAIGIENDGDDMDLLCGQVIGIKKYHTPGGILRLRFLSDASPWTTARGFKLLITRLACERDDYLNETLNGAEEDTEREVSAPELEVQPPHGALSEIFRNVTHTEQHLPYPTAPLFGWNIWPGHLPVPPPPLAEFYAPQPSQQPEGPNIGGNKPCLPDGGFVGGQGPIWRGPGLGYRSSDAQKPQNSDQYLGVWPFAAQKQEREQSLRADNLVKPANDAQSRQQFTPNAHFGAGGEFSPQLLPPFAGSVHPQFGSGPYPGTQFGGTHLGPAQFGGTQIGGTQLGGTELGATQSGAPQFGSPQLGATQFGASTPFSTAPTGPVPPSLTQQCCSTAFNQKRFYLSSPGFPRTAFTSLLPAQQRDCSFDLEKSADNICRLRIEFKFFNYGNGFQGSGAERGNIQIAITTSRDVCTEDFIEIEGERFCGCRTGYIYTSPWRYGGSKKIRMRMGYSGIPSNGFLLDIYQEECGAIDSQIPRPTQGAPEGGLQTTTGGSTNLSSLSAIQNSTPPSLLSQQQLPLYQSPPYFRHPASAALQNTLSLDQTPYRPLQTPNINPYLPPHPIQLWPSTVQPTYADLYPNQFGAYAPPVALYRQGKIMNSAHRAASTQQQQPASTHQPMRVVETNSTRKEYYYYDGDEAFGRLRSNDEPNDIDRNGIAPEALTSSPSTRRDRCTFTTMDVLRLTVDSLWTTKPICYAPLRSWFN